jgi:uncharacterized membrane protein (UPF0127 family)
MTNQDNRPDDDVEPDNAREQGDGEIDPTHLPVFPEGTLARRIINRLKNPRVLLVLVIVFVPMLGWVGFTTYSDLTSPDYATAYIFDGDGDYIGSVEGEVAATWRERHTGLSNTDSLEAGHGMFFVHESEGEHTYVMRDMSFAIDIVFIDKDGQITTIHHAEVEETELLTEYQGRAKYVLEVPYEWTVSKGIDVGHTVDIEWGRQRATTGTRKASISEGI